ncbi:hypothetical protein Droror1_Dr00024307 [Drosera rotundifolia]
MRSGVEKEASAADLDMGVEGNESSSKSLLGRDDSLFNTVTGSKFPSRKPFVGQKKPYETHGSSSSLSSKKRKVSEASVDQSTDHLSDVTTLSDVDLLAELEELFPIVKSGSQISEVPSRGVQKEEERLIREKISLQKKCGIKNIGNDVERWLSLVTFLQLQFFAGKIANTDKESGESVQRVDSEKSGHRAVVTSDIQQQISSINRKAKEEQKKQAEAQKLHKLYEANKEKNNQIRTSAAKVSTHATVGNDDILSRWQLMAERLRGEVKVGLPTHRDLRQSWIPFMGT